MEINLKFDSIISKKFSKTRQTLCHFSLTNILEEKQSSGYCSNSRGKVRSVETNLCGSLVETFP